MREKLYKILEVSDGNNIASSIYDYFMIVVIIAGIVPLAFKQENFAFTVIELTCFSVFALDYLCRWLTADFHLGRGKLSFLLYPFSFMAIIDLVSMLPSVTVLNDSFKLVRIIRLFRAFRVLRVIKAFRYSKNIKIISEVLKKSRRSLATVGTLAVVYIIVSALVVFNVEPDTFPTFFDAVYWATISLTTVGYGDIFPVSVAGRVVTMLSSMVGIAIVALPAGVITAGYMKELELEEREKLIAKLAKNSETAEESEEQTEGTADSEISE